MIPGMIYLSREGKVFGPYTPEQLAEFRQNGEIAKYAWMWDEKGARWSALHDLPPAPMIMDDAVAVTAPTAAPKEKTKDHLPNFTRPAFLSGGNTPATSEKPMAMPTVTARYEPVHQRKIENTESIEFDVADIEARAQAKQTAHVAGNWSRIQVVCHDFHHLLSGMIDEVLNDGFLIWAESPASQASFFRKGQKLWVNLVDDKTGSSENTSGVLAGYSRKDNGWQYYLKWEQRPKMLD